MPNTYRFRAAPALNRTSARCSRSNLESVCELTRTFVQTVNTNVALQQVRHAHNNLRTNAHADQRAWDLRRLSGFAERMKVNMRISLRIREPSCFSELEPECQLLPFELTGRCAIVIGCNVRKLGRVISNQRSTREQ